jgi:hypothetical protein
LQNEVACLNSAVRGVADRIKAIQMAHERLRQRLPLSSPLLDEQAWQAVRDADLELARCIAAFVPHDTGDMQALTEAQPTLEVAVGAAP